MGSTNFYPEERPVHEVTVDGFWMDRYAVTNEQFARFVAETGYVTLAERPPRPEDFPGAPPENLVPGSMVFQKRKGPGRSAQLRQLVGMDAGRELAPSLGPTQLARRPRSASRSCTSRYEDVEAYARWANKDLPTEAEWEFAARGGLDGATFTWGNDEFPTACRW